MYDCHPETRIVRVVSQIKKITGADISEGEYGGHEQRALAEGCRRCGGGRMQVDGPSHYVSTVGVR